MRVALLGLGTMGAAMARNIGRHGHALTVWNRTPAKADALAAEVPGVAVAATPADAARGAEIVITMLADPPSLRAVLCGVDGALPAMAAGAVLVDMSTVDPATVRALAATAAGLGVEFVDAPVSGSRRPAEQGTLLILAAGSDAAVAYVRPVLETMGRVRPVGPSGSGAAMKLVLNGLGAHLLAGLASMLVLAVQQGLDPAAAIEVIQGGAFSSPLFALKGAKILDRDFSPDFTLALMLKDQELVLQAARAAGLPLPTVQAIRDQVAAAVEAGFGEQDLCALVRHVEAAGGVTVERAPT